MPFPTKGSFLLLLAFLLSPPAQAESSGKFELKQSSTSYQVKSWGQHCGDKPRPSVQRGKVYEVSDVGTRLILKRGRRTLSTDACQSPNPRLTKVRSVKSGNAWTVECKTKEGDPHFEHGNYQFQLVSPDLIQYRETTTYHWKLMDSDCHVTATTTQAFQRLAPEAGVVDKPPEPPKAAEVKGCDKPGPIARIELSPHRALLPPGERTCFRSQGFDLQGCKVPGKPEWSLSQETTLGHIDGKGCLTVEREAQAGRIVVKAQVGQAFGEANVRVAKQEMVLITRSLLDDDDEEEDPPAPESPEAEAAPSQEHGVKPIIAEPDDEDDTLGVLLLGAGLATSLLVGLALMLLRRKGPRKDRTVVEALSKICPQCHRVFARDGQFCPFDASALEPNHTAKRALVKPPAPQPSGERSKLCPKCGTPYPAEAEFCGKDGTPLGTGK